MCQGERERSATDIDHSIILDLRFRARCGCKKFPTSSDPKGGAKWWWIPWYNPWKITKTKTKTHPSKYTYHNPWSVTPSPLKHIMGLCGTGVYTTPASFFGVFRQFSPNKNTIQVIRLEVFFLDELQVKPLMATRNPKANHRLDGAKTLGNNEINYVSQLVQEFFH